MSYENLFISSAANSGIMALVFIYLHNQARGQKAWQAVWLIGVFLSLIYAFGVERWGWEHVAVASEVAEISFVVFQALMWGMILVLGYLLMVLVLELFSWLMAKVSGRKQKEFLKS